MANIGARSLGFERPRNRFFRLKIPALAGARLGRLSPLPGAPLLRLPGGSV